jgi:hypothetical protein
VTIAADGDGHPRASGDPESNKAGFAGLLLAGVRGA